ncbi:transporter substrate-binding domain-containing protein, partial [Mesorhizobium sp. M7A.F.Ca.ET.027.03.2.1]
MKRVFLTAAFAALTVYPTLSADLPLTSDVKDSGTLSIASGLDYAPFEFTDEKGEPAGLDVELSQVAAKLMGVKLDLKRIPFASQIPALTAGRIKVGWATFTVKADRLKQVDFVTFLKSGTVAAVLPENLSKFQGQNSLCGAKVAVQT